MTLDQVASLCGGHLVSGDGSTVVNAVSTDTRTISSGALFVALAGERFDAHDFLGQAVESGATACLVHKVPEGVEGAFILVEDTLVGLQALAAGYREVLDIAVIGITGSNGKTSTKDLISSVLRQGFKVSATLGNLNNHIGLPLSVLSAGESDQCGVWEMGMSNPGEIAPLAAIAKPDVGVITNVGTAHIEFMGTRDAIALEKGMLAEAVNASGCVVLGAEDEYTESISARTAAAVMTGGIECGDVQARNLESDAKGSQFELVYEGKSVAVHLPVPGRHMVQNATLAACVGLRQGLDLEAVATGLGAVELTGGRLQSKEVAGVCYVDDSYNANPDSMRAALATLAGFACQGRRIAVLGRMAEIGARADEEHESVGRAVAEAGIDQLLTVGTGEVDQFTKGFGEAGGDPAGVFQFSDHVSCAEHLAATAKPGDIVLVKGSRSSAMEKVIKEVSDL